MLPEIHVEKNILTIVLHHLWLGRDDTNCESLESKMLSHSCLIRLKFLNSGLWVPLLCFVLHNALYIF